MNCRSLLESNGTVYDEKQHDEEDHAYGDAHGLPSLGRIAHEMAVRVARRGACPALEVILVVPFGRRRLAYEGSEVSAMFKFHVNYVLKNVKLKTEVLNFDFFPSSLIEYGVAEIDSCFMGNSTGDIWGPWTHRR